MSFPHLIDYEVIHLLGDFSPILNFDEFNNLTYDSHNDYSYSYVSDDCDPELNNLNNISFPYSDYGNDSR